MKHATGLKAILQVTISMELAQRLNRLAQKQNVTVPALVRMLLENAVEKTS